MITWLQFSFRDQFRTNHPQVNHDIYKCYLHWKCWCLDITCTTGAVSPRLNLLIDITCWNDVFGLNSIFWRPACQKMYWLSGTRKGLQKRCMALLCKDTNFYMLKNLKISAKEFPSYGHVCMAVSKCTPSTFYGMKLTHIFGVIPFNTKYDRFLKNLAF